MAGINLLDQLKAKRSGGGLSEAPSPKLDFSLGPSGGENLGILMRLIFLGIAGYVGYVTIERYHEDETTKLQGEIAQIDAGIAQENKKKSRMRNVDEEMRGYLARVEELKGKLRAVSQQETDRSYLIRALEYVAVEMPKDIWLTEVVANRALAPSTNPRSANAAESGSTATFKGYAINAQAVSDFIQKLEASVYFPSTILDRMELIPASEVSSPQPGTIPIIANSRRFQIMAKLGE